MNGAQLLLENAIRDARCAVRMARRNPGFTLLAVATLALDRVDDSDL